MLSGFPLALPLVSPTMRLVRPEQQQVLRSQKKPATKAQAVAIHVICIHFVPTLASTPNSSNALLNAPWREYVKKVAHEEATRRKKNAI